MGEFFKSWRREKRIITPMFASFVMLFPASLGLSFSIVYLPPMGEMPPSFENRRDGNWAGQGGLAGAYYSFLLLFIAYCIKRIIPTRCATISFGLYVYSLVILLSLPYIWFLCSSDWFQPHIYRVACWVGDPISIWFVPSVSFLADFHTRPSFRQYLIRSSIEMIVIIPIWVVFWVFFSFFALDFGWI